MKDSFFSKAIENSKFLDSFKYMASHVDII